jgi:hypothetical protein
VSGGDCFLLVAGNCGFEQQDLLTISRETASDVIMSPSPRATFGMIFSSIGALNLCFPGPAKCGLDVNGVIESFSILMKDLDCLSVVTKSFADAIAKLPAQNFADSLRFLVIGLLHPSVADFPEGRQLWRNLLSLIRSLDCGPVLFSWLSEFDEDSLSRIRRSLMSLLDQTLGEVATTYCDEIVVIIGALGIVRNSCQEKLGFQHNAISQRLDFGHEIECWLGAKNGYCYTKRSPWILSTFAKTRFYGMRANVMMNGMIIINERTQRRLISFNVPQSSFVLRINRNNLLADTFSSISETLSGQEGFRRRLVIVFKNEDAQDEGGVQREFFQLLVNELFYTGKHFWIFKNNFAWPNSEAKDPASLQTFFLTGIIFGLSVFNGNLLNVNLPLAFLKKLRNMALGLEDLREFDPELSESIGTILSYEGNVTDYIDMPYCYGDIPLCPGGESVMVTNENRREYCRDVLLHVFHTEIDVQFNEFKNGFYMVAESVVLDMFDPVELRLLIAGQEELDFAALQQHTRYEGYTAQSRAVEVFWNIVHNRMCEEEKRRLLLFVAACPRAPAGGLGILRMLVIRDGDASHLPTSHTCAFALKLPDDPDEDRMYQKFKIALEHTKGFGFK